MTITIDNIIENQIGVVYSGSETNIEAIQNNIDVSISSKDIVVSQTVSPITLNTQINNISLYDTNYPITIEMAGIGVSGKSAYEIAVEHGFIGTEAQWLVSLASGGTGGAGYDIDLDGIVDLAEKATIAAALETARTISISGDAIGSAVFDGTTNIDINVSISSDSHTHSISTLTGVAPINSPIFTGVPQITSRGNILAETDTLNGGYF